jgi:anaerobic magnesium-protoporphyrin IX monomethyl ester cyclase
MMKITLIYPKTSWKFEKTPYPPLGLGYLATVLQQNNWDVSLIDGQILKPEKYKQKLCDINEKIIGISTTIKQIKETERIAKLIKEKNPKTVVVVGGPGISVLNLQEVQNIDIVVKGEADNEIIKLLKEIQTKKTLNKITKYPKVGNVILVNCKNPTNLDKIPYPSREILNLDKYLKIWKKNTNMTSTNMISSRGCPYGCIFCDKNIAGRNFRARSAKNIVDEIEYLSTNYKLDDIFFYDDLFVYNRERVILICKEILNRKLKINWSAQARVDKIDIKMLKIMKESGCLELYFGAESGSNKILKYLKKGFTRQQIIEAFEMCHKTNIKPGMFIITGVPGETKKDIEATETLIKKCRPFLLNFSYLMPFQGTALFEKTKHLIKNYNYTQWDEMNNTIYDFPFEIDPKDAHDKIYQTFQKMTKNGMEHSSLQFCCNQ